MREILFRGQRVDNGQWVCGSLVYVTDGNTLKQYPNIVISYNHDTFDWHDVEPETIGQFTGLLDKNGNKIFEEDKVKFHYFYQGIYSGGAIECEKEVEGVIEITPFGLFLKCDNPDDGGYLLFYQPHEESFEIIGNIHEDGNK